jgi:hypothetical protein
VIIRLLPQQIVKIWTSVRFAIAETYLPRSLCTNEILHYTLSRLLSGRSQCWAIMSAEREFLGFLITRIMIDEMTGQRVLSLDHIYGYAPLSDEVWQKGFETLSKFALKNKCSCFTCLTDNPKILQIANYFGSITRTLVIKEL